MTVFHWDVFKRVVPTPIDSMTPCRNLRLVQQRPHTSLKHDTSTSRTHNNPQPQVLKLLQRRPERILLVPVLIKLRHLLWGRLAVAPCLRSFSLAIPTKVAQEDVVGDWAEEFNGREHVAAEEKDWEGEVDEGVAEVAAQIC